MARLNDEEIDERLAALRGWERDGDAIKRAFKLDDFKGSVDFVNQLTPEAEDMNVERGDGHDHHPLRGRSDRERLRAGTPNCYSRASRRMSDDEPPRSSPLTAAGSR